MTDQTTDRPLVTFALFAYNQEQYIREAVEGAFSQTYEPLEIILSDDCSSDRTYQIMQEMAAAYEGPHEVRIRRNKTNAGLALHVNTVMQEADGEIVVIAAGDDISLPCRTRISVDCLQQNQSATAVLLSADVIDHAGRIVGERRSGPVLDADGTQTLSELLAWRHVTFGATRVLRRDVFNRFGPLNAQCPTEDTPLLLRSLLCGSNALSHHKAILYRRHGSNLSGGASLMTMNTDQIYAQYSDDIQKALTLSLISDTLAQRLHKWLNSDRMIRGFRLQLASQDMLSLRDTIFAIRHPATGPREKLRFLRAYLASAFRKSL